MVENGTASHATPSPMFVGKMSILSTGEISKLLGKNRISKVPILDSEMDTQGVYAFCPVISIPYVLSFLMVPYGTNYRLGIAGCRDCRRGAVVKGVEHISTNL